MPAKTHWNNWEIETIQTICNAGVSGVEVQDLHDAIPLPLNRGWTTFNSALTTLKDKLLSIGLSLQFEGGRATLGHVDDVKTLA